MFAGDGWSSFSYNDERSAHAPRIRSNINTSMSSVEMYGHEGLDLEQMGKQPLKKKGKEKKRKR